MKTKHTLSLKTVEMLGLKEKDLEVYLALLRLGTAPLRRLAEEASLNRGTVYDSLKRLLNVNLVSYVDSKTHRYFTAEDPQRLRGLATRQEVAIREAQLEISETIPELKEIIGQSEHRPAVRYYEGDAGVREILKDVLAVTERAESKQYQVYSSEAVRDLIRAAWPGFTKQRISRHVQVKALAIGEGGQLAELSQRKWLSHDAGSPTYIFIYPGKTAYVSVDSKERLFGVIIEDRAVSQTQKMIFDSLWNSLDDL
ncbi:TrmB family transcriptional regulator [Patescibacteria group bacterium]